MAKVQPRAQVTQLTAIIPAGSSLSNAIDLTAIGQVVRIYMPDAWTEAPITFEVSADNVVPYRPVYKHDGGLIQMVVIIGGAAVLVPDFIGQGLAWFKLRSGTREMPVNQDAARTFMIITTT
jgi:hypothetical protein